MKLRNHLLKIKQEAMYTNANIDWENVILNYLTYHGFMTKIEHEMLRHMNEKDYTIKVNLGRKEDLLNSLSGYVFDKHHTTLSDSGLYKELESFVSKNNLQLKRGEGNYGMELVLFIPLNKSI